MSRVYGGRGDDGPTVDLSDSAAFPEPVAVVSLRAGRVFRALDEDGQPILVVTDGVTSVAFETGLSGLSFGVVVAAQRLAAALEDFATSITAGWNVRVNTPTGAHRRNRWRASPGHHRNTRP